MGTLIIQYIICKCVKSHNMYCLLYLQNMKSMKQLASVVKELECPICFNVPRDLPIPACPAGHIICRTCKSSVTSCPTCRRKLYYDGSNSLAATLIEKVPHKCKFSMYGCEIKEFFVWTEEPRGKMLRKNSQMSKSHLWNWSTAKKVYC